MQDKGRGCKHLPGCFSLDNLSVRQNQNLSKGIKEESHVQNGRWETGPEMPRRLF